MFFMSGPTVEEFCERYGGKSLFETQEEYESFRIEFGRRLAPELRENAIARAKSELWARTHYI